MTRVSPAETAGPHHGTTHDDSDTVHTVAPLPSTELHLAELAARLPDDLFLQLVTARRDARGRAVWRSATYPPRLIGQAAQDAAIKQAKSSVAMSRAQLHKSLKAFGHPPTFEQQSQLIMLQRQLEASEQALAALGANTSPQPPKTATKSAEFKRAKIQLAMRRAALKKAQDHHADEHQLATLKAALNDAEQTLQDAEANG